MGICAAPSYLEKNGRPDNLEQMQGHTAINYGRGGQAFPWSVPDAFGNTTELRLDSRLQFDDLQAIADAAVAGVGLAWLPRWMIAPQIMTHRMRKPSWNGPTPKENGVSAVTSSRSRCVPNIGRTCWSTFGPVDVLRQWPLGKRVAPMKRQVQDGYLGGEKTAMFFLANSSADIGGRPTNSSKVDVSLSYLF